MEFKLSNEEIYHLVKIMEERGVVCMVCQRLYDKLKEQIKKD